MISAFASLIGIALGIASSTIGLKVCVINAGIKMHMSIIKKKRKKHGKIISLAKSRLNSIEVLISKALIDWNISHDGFVLISNMLKEFYDMKEEIKSSNDNKLYLKHCCLIVWSVEKIHKVKILKL